MAAVHSWFLELDRFEVRQRLGSIPLSADRYDGGRMSPMARPSGSSVITTVPHGSWWGLEAGIVQTTCPTVRVIDLEEQRVTRVDGGMSHLFLGGSVHDQRQAVAQPKDGDVSVVDLAHDRQSEDITVERERPLPVEDVDQDGIQSSDLTEHGRNRSVATSARGSTGELTRRPLAAPRRRRLPQWRSATTFSGARCGRRVRKARF